MSVYGEFDQSVENCSLTGDAMYNYDSEASKSTIVIENKSNSCMAKALFDCRTSTSKLDYGSEHVADVYADFGSSSRPVQASARCVECEKRKGASASAPTVDMTIDGDWQAALVTPLQRLTQLLKFGHLADVTIEFQDSDEVLKAHRLILGTASPVFERMFYGNSVEAVTGKVRLHCSPTPIKWVLENLYLGTTVLPNVFTAIIVYDVAQMYQMTSIAALCRDYLKYEISMSNVSEIIEVALTHDEEALVKPCLKKLCSSWPEMLQEHISSLTENTWMYLLKKEILPTPEVELFKGLLNWGKRKVEISDDSPSPKLIRQAINKFLPYVRLLSIPSDKFIDQVMPTNIFTAEECSSILMKLRGVPTCLPKTVRCSNIPYSRIDTSEKTLRNVVLSRVCDSRKCHPNALSDIVLIRNFNVSTPILLYQIQTQDNSTLKYAQMIISDEYGVQVGVARSLGAQWRFVIPVFLYANKSYTISIDKVLVSKLYVRKEFCIYSSEIRFKGTTGDNYLKMYFWPALIKS